MGILGRLLSDGSGLARDVRRPLPTVTPAAPARDRAAREDRPGPMDASGVAPAFVFGTAGVLYDDTLNWRWLSQRLMRLGLPYDFQSVYDRWYLMWSPTCAATPEGFAGALRGFLGQLGLTAGQLDEVFAACHLRLGNGEHGLVALPGVASTLAQLSADGLELAVVHTGPQPIACVRHQLAHLQLDSYLPHVVARPLAADSAAACEPFKEVARSLDRSPDACVFVSARLPDLVCAAAVGMRTAWIGRAGHDGTVSADEVPTGDMWLQRFDDLLRIARPVSRARAA